MDRFFNIAVNYAASENSAPDPIEHRADGE
jgi:hypothetical protein